MSVPININALLKRSEAVPRDSTSKLVNVPSPDRLITYCVLRRKFIKYTWASPACNLRYLHLTSPSWSEYTRFIPAIYHKGTCRLPVISSIGHRYWIASKSSRIPSSDLRLILHNATITTMIQPSFLARKMSSCSTYQQQWPYQPNALSISPTTLAADHPKKMQGAWKTSCHPAHYESRKAQLHGEATESSDGSRHDKSGQRYL